MTESSTATDATQQSHPLNQTWVLHYNGPAEARRGDWNVAVKRVMTLNTVEQFWSLYNSIKQPSALTVGSNYHFFIDGIKPEWEDPANAKGGKWQVTIKRSSGDAAKLSKQLDDYWLYTLLMTIGDTLSHCTEITGIVVSPRAKEYRLALWTRNGDNEEIVKSIGAQWKEILKYDGTIDYTLHYSTSKSAAYTL